MISRGQPELPPDLLDRLAGLVSAHLGLDFTASRQRDLVRGLQAVFREMGRKGGGVDPVACARQLLSEPHLSREQLDALAIHLTVGETYFFRTRALFETLENSVLPRLARQAEREGRPLRLWSAGCSSGEEPFSLAIVLDRLGLLKGAVEEAGRPVLGSDINPLFLAKAKLGIYSDWSFRDTPPWLIQEYFEPAGQGRYAVVPRIRRAVRFITLNLVRDAYPDLASGTAGVDLILCRHVLMYFHKAAADEVVRRLRLSLREGGCLIVSPAEVAHLDLSRFRPERIGETLVHWNDPVPPAPAARTVFAPLPLEPAIQPLPWSVPQPPSLWPPLARPSVSPAVLSPTAPFEPPAPPSVQAPSAPGAPSPEGPPLPDVVPVPGELEDAECLYARGEYEQAIRTLEAHLALMESRTPESLSAGETAEMVECLLLGARAWANLGHFDQALRWSRRAADLGRMNPEAHYLLATILLEQGRTQEAVVALRRVLYLVPDFAPAQLALARAAFMSENPEEGVRVVRRLLEGLSARPPGEEVPGAEGLTVGALRGFARAMLEQAGEVSDSGPPEGGNRRR